MFDCSISFSAHDILIMRSFLKNSILQYECFQFATDDLNKRFHFAYRIKWLKSMLYKFSD